MEHASGPCVLTINHGRIESIQRGRGGDVDHRTELVAMPGLIDAHDHVGVDVGDELPQARESIPQNLLRGVYNLRMAVECGVTTLRNAGERPGVEEFWKEGLLEGFITGPRLVGAGAVLSRTGGHCWYSAQEVDGVDAIRKAVRLLRRDGADFVKVMATGGLATVGSMAKVPEFTFEELHALVDESHRLGLRVAAHAYGGSGVDDAIELGVDSIEHGTLLSEAQLDQMAKAGIPLVLTSTIIKEFLKDPSVPPGVVEQMTPLVDAGTDLARLARDAGVSIAVGTDGVHGNVVGELETLQAAGFSLADALTAATRTAAIIIGRDDLGEIAVGEYADLLFVDDDPTAGLGTLRSPRGVMIGGRWIVPPLPDQLSPHSLSDSVPAFAR